MIQKHITLKKPFTPLLSSIALITILSACGSGDSEDGTEGAQSTASENELEVEEVELYGVIDTQVSAQQIIAEEMGYFEEEGLSVANNIVQSGPDIGPLIASGDAESSFETTITNISLRANDVPTVVVSPMANVSGTQAVIAREDLEINNAEDIEGTTIGMVQGAGVSVALNNMAEDLGVDMDTVSFINMSPTDQIAALENGDIDIMAAWEPWITIGLDQGAQFLFSGSTSEIPGAEGDVEWMQYYSTFQVTEDFLNNNPNTVQAMLRALNKATDYINDNRDEAVDIMDEQLENLPRDQVEEVMSRNNYSMEITEDMEEGSTVIAEFMEGENNISRVPEYEEYTNFDLLEEVLEDN